MRTFGITKREKKHKDHAIPLSPWLHNNLERKKKERERKKEKVYRVIKMLVLSSTHFYFAKLCQLTSKYSKARKLVVVLLSSYIMKEIDYSLKGNKYSAVDPYPLQFSGKSKPELKNLYLHNKLNLHC